VNGRAGTLAGLVAVILAAGVAVALPASLIIVALHTKADPADPELIAVISTLAAAAVGAVGGYLLHGSNGGALGAGDATAAPGTEPGTGSDTAADSVP
jgi:hypothetical protein